MPQKEKKNTAIIIADIIIIILLLIIIFILLTKKDESKETDKIEPAKQTEETKTDKDKENQAVDNAWSTIDAVKIAYAEAQTNSEPVILPYTVNFPKGNNKGNEGVDWGKDEDTGGAYGRGYVNNEELKSAGTLPEEGFVTIEDDGSLIAYKLKFGDYYCSTINENDKSTFDSDSMICSTDENDVEIVNYNH